jgi:hypothetical protein
MQIRIKEPIECGFGPEILLTGYPVFGFYRFAGFQAKTVSGAYRYTIKKAL